MGLFGTTAKEGAEALDRLTAEIKTQSIRLAEVEAKLDASREALGLSEKIANLKVKVADLEIEKAKKLEEFDRREREVTHMVGLERKRQEFEIDVAKRETTVAVREENLSAEQKRFEDQIAFSKEQIKNEIDRFEKLLVKLVDALPSANIEIRRSDTSEAD